MSHRRPRATRRPSPTGPRPGPLRSNPRHRRRIGRCTPRPGPRPPRLLYPFSGGEGGVRMVDLVPKFCASLAEYVPLAFSRDRSKTSTVQKPVDRERPNRDDDAQRRKAVPDTCTGGERARGGRSPLRRPRARRRRPTRRSPTSPRSTHGAPPAGPLRKGTELFLLPPEICQGRWAGKLPGFLSGRSCQDLGGGMYVG